MRIELNGEPLETTDDLSLFQLLAEHQLDQRKGIAVAVDNNVVPRAQWNETVLEDGKKIVVFTAAQGG
ncbi:MAG TPA: sulfur carrier protein ThiS [Chitinophagales bacterium]|nr:sulfur carrier protein ThiS [Chitinophagales bacterium]